MTPQKADQATTYTPDVKQAIQAYAAFMKAEGLSQQEAGARLGCSSTTVSRAIRFAYPGRADLLADRMLADIEKARKQKLAPRRPPFAETSVSERVFATLDVAHVEQVLAVVMGGTGVGKTMAARAYAAGTADSAVVYIEALPNESLASFATRLAGQVGAPAQGSAAATVAAVIDALSGTGKLIIIDEADHLDQRHTLQAMRMVQERADVGMVWVCTSDFLAKLRKLKSGTANQILGRVARVEYIAEASGVDIEAVVAPFALAKGELSVLARHSHGEVRRAINLLMEARRVNGEGITARTLDKASKRLMARAGGSLPS